MSALKKSALKTFTAGTLLLVAHSAFAQFSFEDRTAISTIDFTGESYGSSWGDVNADGLPDVYVNHHRYKPGMYVNNGDQTFTDIASNTAFWNQYPLLDQHGATWGDFNRDGFQDLFQSLGAADINQFMVNHNGTLTQEATEYNIEYRSWPGRMPVFLDSNLDGQMDFTLMQRGRPLHFTQNSDTFTNVSNAVNTRCDDTQYGQLADINNDGRLDLLCAAQSNWPNKIYDMSTVPFTDITSMLPNVKAVNDSAIGDFNNDQRPDFFVLRGTLRPSDAAITTAAQTEYAGQVQAHLPTAGSREETFTFQSAGILHVYLDWQARNVNRMYIGSAGVHPTGFTGSEPIRFTLDPSNPNTWGLKPHNSATDEGMYMGYDPATETWTFSASPGGQWSYTWWTINSEAPVSNLTLVGPGGAENGLPPALLVSGPGGYTDQAAARGLNQSVNCVSVIAADLDNDMDEDLYLVCRNGVTNLANKLYENDGSGNFTEVPGAGGAEGPLGFNVGRGESVSTADYDLNGFLDLYLTNGLNLYPEPPDSLGGPDVLLANLGNANSWIQLELVGTTSNASAIGARVLATAGGVTQLREQNGGLHRWTQNHQRIHLGLGVNTTVNLQIAWPNGLVENYDNVPANNIYKVTEGAGYQILLPTAGQRTITVDDPVASETDGIMTFTVQVSGSGDDVSVDYTTADQVATQPDDYTLTAGSLLFTTGINSQTVEVPIVDDADEEGSEQFLLQLSNEVNGVVIKPAGIATIVDNDIAACGAPTYDPGTDLVLLLWEDCGTGNWHLRSTAGGSFSNNIGTITSSEDYVAFAPFSIEGHDVLNISDPKVIDFNLKAWGASEDGFDFTVAGGATACFNLAGGSSVTSVLVGPSGLPVSGEFDLATLGPCVSDPPPPDPETEIYDGVPAYNSATDTGLYVWRDAATDTWHLRTTAGGTFAEWTGTMTASSNFTSMSGYSIEGHDTFDVSNPAALGFTMKIWGTAEDGADFTFPADTSVCLNLTTPGGASAVVGAGNAIAPVPFDLKTLGACVP